MALEKFKCTNCGKDFEAGDWLCKSGEAHTVESKRYYMTDAPAYKEDCKYSRTIVCNVIPEKKQTIGTDIVTIPGVNVEFIRGMFETDNPQLQMGLNKRVNIFSGPDGEKRWQAAYLSKDEKADMEQAKLRSELSRLQSENNSLLSQVQEKARKSA